MLISAKALITAFDVPLAFHSLKRLLRIEGVAGPAAMMLRVEGTDIHD